MRKSSLDKKTQTAAIYHDKQTEARRSNIDSLLFFQNQVYGNKDLSDQLYTKCEQNNCIVPIDK